MDFYVSSLMTPTGKTETGEPIPRTIPPATMEGLYPNGVADLSKSVLSFGKNSIGGLTQAEQKLIPFASRIENLEKKGGFSKFLSALASLGGAGGVSVESKEERAERDKEIDELVQSIGLPKKDILSYLTKYNAMTDKEKSAVKTLGKIMQLPQANVALKNKDNVINEDGNVYIGLIATINDSQLDLSDGEIENLNALYGKKILTTTNSKIVGDDGKTRGSKTFEIQLWNEHSTSPEAQSAYNSNLGIKNSNANLQLYQQMANKVTADKAINSIYQTYEFDTIYNKLDNTAIRNIKLNINNKTLSVNDILSSIKSKAIGKDLSVEEMTQANKDIAALYYQLQQQGVQLDPL
jgi:hypothetical protein